MKLRLIVLLVALGSMIALVNSCSKDKLFTGSDARVEFSTDTLTFDTVFTQMGQATRKFKLYNPYDQPIKISRIWLAGGSASPFRLNIDGLSATEATDVEIAANDSIYIFSTVYIDPNNDDNPLVVFDSVMTEFNGNIQSVTLQAWGQDAVYIGQVGAITEYIGQNVVFTNNKPYVIMGWVSFDQGSTLTINPGTRVHMFGGPVSRPGERALLYIGDNSTLRVLGIPSNPVTFSTHRLEDEFQDLPFQWEAILLSSRSKNNLIRNAVIRNAVYGVRVDSLSTNSSPKLDIRGSFIYNTAEAGILGLNGSIYAENCVVANSNKYNLLLAYGGDYQFSHCTFANYGTGLVDRSKPILLYKNYLVVPLDETRDTVLQAAGNARFTNCILYGTQRNEIELDPLDNSSTPFNYLFDHCLIKVDTLNSNLLDCFRNKEPYFVDPDAYDFHIDTLVSSAVNTGKQNLTDYNGNAINFDFDGNTRDSQPDMGAYEFD